MVGFSFEIRASPSDQIAAPRSATLQQSKQPNTCIPVPLAFHAARLPGLKASNHYTSPLPSDVLGRDFDSLDRITAAVVPEEIYEV